MCNACRKVCDHLKAKEKKAYDEWSWLATICKIYATLTCIDTFRILQFTLQNATEPTFFPSVE